MISRLFFAYQHNTDRNDNIHSDVFLPLLNNRYLPKSSTYLLTYIFWFPNNCKLIQFLVPKYVRLITTKTSN